MTSPDCISSEEERDGGQIHSDDDDDLKQKASAFTPMIENRGSYDAKQKVPDGSSSRIPQPPLTPRAQIQAIGGVRQPA